MGYLGSSAGGFGFLGDYAGAYFGAPVLPPVPAIGPSGTLIPWLPEQPVKHRIEWRTDVLKGRRGHERRASQITAPRESYELEFVLDAPQARYLRARLFNDAAAIYMLPQRWQGLLGTNALAPGGTGVLVGTTTLSDWAVAGHRVLVEDDRGTRHVTHLQAVAAGSLTLSDGLTAGYTFEANTYRVYPLVAVYLADAGSAGYHAVSAAKVALKARAVLLRPILGAGAALTSFDGYPVLDRRPRLRDLANETAEGAIALVDYGAIATSHAEPLVGDVVRVHDFTWRTDAERQWWLKFIATTRGSQKRYLLPTWLDDLVVASQPSGDGFLRVYADAIYSDAYRGNFMLDWQSSTGHDWIQAELADGTLAYRKITAAVDNLDGTQTLTLNAAIDTTGANPDITRISYMELARLSEDVIEFDHLSTLSRFRLGSRVVQQ